MIILGIETSCDDTGLALIETRILDGVFECRVISSLVHSQADLHSPYGGVFPTLAKREHEKNLVPLLEKIIDTLRAMPSSVVAGYDAHITEFRALYSGQNRDLVESVCGAPFLAHKPHIDAIAVTQGPGLEPALWTGITFAEMVSKLWDIPLIPINHMEGHIVGSLLPSDENGGGWQRLKPLHMPALALLISGGHTELVRVESSRESRKLSYSIIGQTKDDAVGEAFDKVARLLGLSYPGGPLVSALAAQARERGIVSPIKLPRPMIASKDLNFSFSGLKTAVLYAIKELGGSGSLSDDLKMGLARECEDAITETLGAKLRKALDETGAQTVIIGGGVSANTELRAEFETIVKEYDITLYMPSRHVSGDNALMIALAGTFDAPPALQKIRAQGTKRLGPNA